MNNVLSALKHSSPICSSGAAQRQIAKDCLRYAASESELWFGGVHTCSMILLHWNCATNHLKKMIADAFPYIYIFLNALVVG